MKESGGKIYEHKGVEKHEKIAHYYEAANQVQRLKEELRTLREGFEREYMKEKTARKEAEGKLEKKEEELKNAWTKIEGIQSTEKALQTAEKALLKAEATLQDANQDMNIAEENNKVLEAALEASKHKHKQTMDRAKEIAEEYMKTGKIQGLDAIRQKQKQPPVKTPEKKNPPPPKIDLHPLPKQQQENTGDSQELK